MAAAAAELGAEIGQVEQIVGPDHDMDCLRTLGQRLEGVHLVSQGTSTRYFLQMGGLIHDEGQRTSIAEDIFQGPPHLALGDPGLDHQASFAIPVDAVHPVFKAVVVEDLAVDQWFIEGNQGPSVITIGASLEAKLSHRQGEKTSFIKNKAVPLH